MSIPANRARAIASRTLNPCTSNDCPGSCESQEARPQQPFALVSPLTATGVQRAASFFFPKSARTRQRCEDHTKTACHDLHTLKIVSFAKWRIPGNLLIPVKGGAELRLQYFGPGRLLGWEPKGVRMSEEQWAGMGWRIACQGRPTSSTPRTRAEDDYPHIWRFARECCVPHADRGVDDGSRSRPRARGTAAGGCSGCSGQHGLRRLRRVV